MNMVWLQATRLLGLMGIGAVLLYLVLLRSERRKHNLVPWNY